MLIYDYLYDIYLDGGRTLVDIREYYTNASGDTLPGKKGIYILSLLSHLFLS